MNWNEIRGLKYFIAYAAIVIGGFAYSSVVGWKWWNSTQTTQEKNEGDGSHHGGRYFYHK
jgi:hypothetical protein